METAMQLCLNITGLSGRMSADNIAMERGEIIFAWNRGAHGLRNISGDMNWILWTYKA